MTNLTRAITIVPAITSSAFKVLETNDRVADKQVRALVQLCDSPVVTKWFIVWSGDDYDQAGQWTDATLAAEIKDQIENAPADPLPPQSNFKL